MRVRRISAALIGVACALDGSVASAQLTKTECVAANERAQNLRDAGRLRDARADLGVCVSTSCPAPVRQDCADRIAEIDRAMPTVVFEVTDRAGYDVAGVSIRVDGESVRGPVDGEAVPVDPGTHVLRFLLPDGEEQEETIVVREGQKARRVRVVRSVSPTSRRAEKTAAAVAIGTGSAALLAGGILGLVAKATYDTAVSSQCHGDLHACSARGVGDVGTAHSEALASTVAVIGGSVVAVGGVVLWVAAGRGIKLVPSASGASLDLMGVF